MAETGPKVRPKGRNSFLVIVSTPISSSVAKYNPSDAPLGEPLSLIWSKQKGPCVDGPFMRHLAYTWFA